MKTSRLEAFSDGVIAVIIIYAEEVRAKWVSRSSHLREPRGGFFRLLCVTKTLSKQWK